MKILINAVLDLNKDGAGVTHFTEVANNFQKEDHEVLALCPGFYPNRKKDCGFKIVYVPIFKKNIFSMLLYEFLNIFFLAFWAIRFKPDILYCRYNVATLYPSLISKLLKVNYFVEVNGIVENELRQRQFPEFVIRCVKLTEIINFKFAKKIIVVTNGIKKEIQKKYKIPEIRLEVVGNGANTTLFYPMDKEKCRYNLLLEKNAFYVGFVGSFAPWQGLETLIKAAKQVKELKYSRIKYLLVGSGERENIIRRLVKKLGLEQEVLFIGHINYEKVAKYINAFDIAVAPFSGKGSKALGSPLKLYEYLACAKPVIASQIDGVTDVIEEGEFGYLFEPGNEKDLTSKIVQAYQGKRFFQEMGLKGRKLIESKYSWRLIAQKIIKILNEAITKKTIKV